VYSFIETKLFTRLVQEYLSDDEYQALQKVLIERRDAGDVVPAPAAFASFVGVQPVAESAAGIA